MAGLFTAIGAIGKILEEGGDVKNAKDAVRLGREIASNIRTDGSITKFLSKFIVEPVIIISKNANESEMAYKTISLNTSLFASFYAQAFQVLTGINDVKVNVALDLLATDNGGIISRTIGKGADMIAGESYNTGRDYIADLFNDDKVFLSTEAITISGNRQNNPNRNADERLIHAKLNQAANRGKPYEKPIKDGTEKSDKSTVRSVKGFEKIKTKYDDLMGEELYYMHHREINIKVTADKTTISDTSSSSDHSYKDEEKDTITKNSKSSKSTEHRGSKTFIVPIVIKSHIIVTDIDNIINMLKPNDRTKQFGYRFNEWRAGSITLRELLFCGDLIEQYKKNKLYDKKGLISLIKQREESANSKVITNGQVGFEKFYNMLITTADERVYLNKHVGGDIMNERYKQELLTEAHALTISLLDDDYERLTVLTKDIRGVSSVNYRNLKKQGSKNDDLTSVMSALMSNRPPVF